MITRLVGVVVALLLGFLAGGATGTTALLTDSDPVSAGEFSVGTLLAPGTPTVEVTNLTGGRRITWTAANVDSGVPGQATVNRYQVMRYSAATGGTGTQVCDITTQALTCTLTGQPAIAYYSVIATVQAWTAESARGTTAPDTTKPTISFTWPTNGYTAKRGDYDNRSKTFCGNLKPVACGTATDDVNVTGVTYRLVRTVGTTVTCWNGSAWVANSLLGSCNTTFYDATLTTTGTTRVWHVPGAAKDAYNATAGQFTLAIRAVDAVGNNSDTGALGNTPQSISFTSTN